MKRYAAGVTCAVFLVSAALFFGCSRETNLTGDERDALVKLADPVAGDILTGFNTGNYTLWAKHFDEIMKNTLTEKVFNQTRDLIISKIGKYQSKEVDRVTKKGAHRIVQYKAVFEKESAVSVRVVFTKYGDKELVSGLWFNSPKLNK